MDHVISVFSHYKNNEYGSHYKNTENVHNSTLMSSPSINQNWDNWKKHWKTEKEWTLNVLSVFLIFSLNIRRNSVTC